MPHLPNVGRDVDATAKTCTVLLSMERMWSFGIFGDIGHWRYPCCSAELGLQAICIMAAFNKDWPLLVVCPSSLRMVWEEELQEWLPPNLLPTPDNVYTIMSGKVRSSNACIKHLLTALVNTLLSTSSRTGCVNVDHSTVEHQRAVALGGAQAGVSPNPCAKGWHS